MAATVAGVGAIAAAGAVEGAAAAAGAQRPHAEVSKRSGTPRTTQATLTAMQRMTRCGQQGRKPAVITVSHLVKRYGALVAVDDLSFDVGRGEIVGFLGPNGAGKSTTLRILAGFLGPTGGKVTIAGHDIVEDSFEARRSMGYMPEAVPLYPEMRVVEYLRFRAELKRLPARVRAGHVDDALRKASVVDVAHKRIGHLSRGYRQRVGLADAILARPPLVVLDEPTAGLDPNQIRETRALIRELGREHTVVLSTHILGEVEQCATRVLLLHRGRLVAEGPTDHIRSMRVSAGVDLVVRGDGQAAADALSSVDGISGTSRLASNDGASRVRVKFSETLTNDQRADATEHCVAVLVRAGVGVREVRGARGSLEEVFAALTDSSSSESADNE